MCFLICDGRMNLEMFLMRDMHWDCLRQEWGFALSLDQIWGFKKTYLTKKFRPWEWFLMHGFTAYTNRNEGIIIIIGKNKV